MDRLGWQALLLIPLLAAIYALARLLRMGPARLSQVPLPRFVVASVLVHVGLLFLLDLVWISIPMVEANREVLEEIVRRTFAIVPAREAPEPKWSAVADGPPPASPALESPGSSVAREYAFAPEMRGMSATIPESQARELPAERVLFVPRKEPVPIDAPADDLPREIVMVALPLPAAEVPPTAAIPTPSERMPELPAASVERRPGEAPVPGTSRDVEPALAVKLPDPEPPHPAAMPDVMIGVAPEPLAPQASGLRIAEPVEASAPTLARSTSPDISSPAAPRPIERLPRIEPPRPSEDVAVPRERPPLLREPTAKLPEIAHPADRFDPKLAIPEPKLPAPRLPAPDTSVLPPRDEVVLATSFELRRAEVRKDVVKALGGSAESEAAVERGLAWLAAHQGAEGNWGLNRLNCQGHSCDAAGQVRSDAAATGLALMAMLGAGHAPKRGSHAAAVERGIRWLIAHQKPTGDFSGDGDSQMYAHALATIALCEAFAMSGEASLRAPAARALNFIVEAQEPNSGGWRYTPRSGGDTSVVGWQLMALKSGEMAGLAIPAETYVRASRWLDSVRSGPEKSRYVYQPGRSVTPAMTAEALLCRQYLGMKRQDSAMAAGGAYLLANAPEWKTRNSYYWYYATQVMYHLQGEPWQAWNGKLRDMLVTSQAKDGASAGSWHTQTPSNDKWGERGGRLYETALSLLMLEVYYRHLPLYRQLGASPSEP